MGAEFLAGINFNPSACIPPIGGAFAFNFSISVSQHSGFQYSSILF
jgi:hypothetical protein